MKEYYSSYVRLFMRGVILVILFFIYEAISLIVKYGFTWKLLFYEAISLAYSFGYFLLILIIAIVINNLIYRNRNEKDFFARLILFAYFLTYSFSCNYFISAGILLDEATYAYSVKELIEIIRMSEKGSLFSILSMFLPIGIFGFKKREIRFKGPKLLIFIIVPFPLMALIFPPKPVNFQKEFYYGIVESKGAFFVKRTIVYLLDKRDNTQRNDDIKSELLILQNNLNEFHFVNEKFPFLHKKDSTSVLAPYFELKDTPPNIVVIIVESLSRNLSGPNSKWGSFTPFLDSLVDHSLYWPNCLSTTQRTFGVLPAIFGSLPFGESGFLSYGKTMPYNYTLINFLEANGYYSTFSYGGYLSFDNMKDFVEVQNVEYLNKNLSEKATSTKDKGYWGFSDSEVYENSAQNRCDSIKPQLNIYLTLSSHAPYEFPNKENYYNLYKKLKDKEKVEKYSLNKHKVEISSFVYADNSIRKLFDFYKSQNTFENTIFLITGDHGNRGDDINKYHVPLIIYSPLLKKKAVFNSLVSHRNITPTLIALFEDKMNLKGENEVAWLASQLDTCKRFDSKVFSPLMRVNRRIDDFIIGDIFFNKDEIYKITEGLKLEKIQNENLLNRTKKTVKAYKKIDKYICDNDLLLPYSFNEGKKRIETVFQDAQTENEILFNGEDAIPKKFIKYRIDTLEVGYLIDLEFDVYLDEENKGNGMNLIIDIRKQDGSTRYFSKLLFLGASSSFNYNSWHTFHRKIKIKKEIVGYEKGDVIKVHLWNSGNESGVIKESKCKLFSIKME